MTEPNTPTKPLVAASDVRKRFWGSLSPWSIMVAIVLLAVCQLRIQGRLWWCACGPWSVWAGDVWSSHNSQHLLDPYSFTHVLHGVLLYGLATWAWPRLPHAWRLCLVISIEALWEVFENSAFVIDRFRTVTMAFDYQGDTIANSLGDILSCGFGVVLARRLRFWRSLTLFVVTELILLLWIRDSLLLNVWMLICPSDAIKAWQIGA